jgi:hypothetical protein
MVQTIVKKLIEEELANLLNGTAEAHHKAFAVLSFLLCLVEGLII